MQIPLFLIKPMENSSNSNSSLVSKITLCLLLIVFSCKESETKKLVETSQIDNSEQNMETFEATIRKDLDAVINRDLTALKSTMSPEGNMQLILPGMEIIDKVEGFMEYHKEWFADPNWTFETKVLNTEIGDTMGMAITEIVYREPERVGGPYFNRMIVSYDLKKIDGQWYIIKDHASSIEKSTDVKAEE